MANGSVLRIDATNDFIEVPSTRDGMVRLDCFSVEIVWLLSKYPAELVEIRYLLEGWVCIEIGDASAMPQKFLKGDICLVPLSEFWPVCADLFIIVEKVFVHEVCRDEGFLVMRTMRGV